VDILKNKKFLSRQTSVFDFSKVPSGTHASSPLLLDTGGDDPLDPPTFQEEVSRLQTFSCLSFRIFFVNFS
jgi:hypothetical protein